MKEKTPLDSYEKALAKIESMTKEELVQQQIMFDNMKQPEPRTPIKQLVKEYDMEDVSSQTLVKFGLHYSETMEDCQVRVLLFLLSARLDNYERKYKKVTDNDENV